MYQDGRNKFGFHFVSSLFFPVPPKEISILQMNLATSLAAFE